MAPVPVCDALENPKFPGFAIVRIMAPLDAKTIMEFQKQMESYMSRGLKWLVLDMEQMSFINSTGLAYLINFCDQAKSRDGEISLAAVQPKVITVMKMMGVTQLVSLHPTTEAALHGLEEQARVHEALLPEDAGDGAGEEEEVKRRPV